MPATPDIVSDEDAYLAMSLMQSEREACPQCQDLSWLPRHFRPFIHDGRLIGNADCGSNGRRFDPATKQFIGRPHCTCDVCW